MPKGVWNRTFAAPYRQVLCSTSVLVPGFQIAELRTASGIRPLLIEMSDRQCDWDLTWQEGLSTHLCEHPVSA